MNRFRLFLAILLNDQWSYILSFAIRLPLFLLDIQLLWVPFLNHLFPNFSKRMKVLVYALLGYNGILRLQAFFPPSI